MKEIPLTATRREHTGKGFARRERMTGCIPGVVYGPEIEPLTVSVDERAFRTAMKTGGASALISLDVDGQANTVILRDVQRDPVTSKVTHVDFHAISMTKPIRLSIPIQFVGTSRGVKTDGGIMQITMRDLDISCLPADIPEGIEIDVSDLGIGDSVHVRDVSLAKAEILSPERRTIVVIAAPTVIKAAAGTEEAEEAAEEGVPAEGDEAAAEGAEAAKEEGKEEAK